MASSTRRDFLRTSGLAAAGMSLGPLLNGCATGAAPKATAGGINVEEITVAEVQAAMQSGRLTSVQLVEIYLERIQAMDRTGPALRAVEEINPDALAIARSLDEERKAGKLRGPMHGIPVLLPIYFVFGLMLAGLRRMSGGLVAPVLAHALNNLLGLLFIS